MTDQLRTIRDQAVEIEGLLTKMGGEGKGMGEKARSLGNALPQDVQKHMKQVAHYRNRVMHDGIDLSDRDYKRYSASVQYVLSALNAPKSKPTSRSSSQPPPPTAQSIPQRPPTPRQSAQRSGLSKTRYKSGKPRKFTSYATSGPKTSRRDVEIEDWNTRITILVLMILFVPVLTILGDGGGGTVGLGVSILLGIILRFTSPKLVNNIGNFVKVSILVLFLGAIGIVVLGFIVFLIVGGIMAWGQ